jgi:hypothetical protein
LHIRCTAPLYSRDYDARFAAWNFVDRDPFQIGIIIDQRPSLKRFNGFALLGRERLSLVNGVDPKQVLEQ